MLRRGLPPQRLGACDACAGATWACQKMQPPFPRPRRSYMLTWLGLLPVQLVRAVGRYALSCAPSSA